MSESKSFDFDSFESIEDLDSLSTDELISMFDKLKETDTPNNVCIMCKKVDTIKEDTTKGIAVCNDCGCVQKNIMDCNPEWNQINDDSQSGSSGRYSTPTNYFLPKSSLGTTIACSSFNRLKILHNWSSMPYRERSLYVVLEEINNKCQSNGIKKKIIDDAKYMYKRISESKHSDGKNEGKFIIIRGSNRKSLIAACVFFACRLNGNTRSPKEIADIFSLKLTDITKGCKKFLQFMKSQNIPCKLTSSSPEHFVERFCGILGIHKNYTQEAISIAENIKKLGLASDHTPPSIAAGSILLMSNIRNLTINKKSISKTFRISEVTITKIYRKIHDYSAILTNSEETKKLLAFMNQAIAEKKQSI